MINNPYIELVQKADFILTDLEKISENKWKWSDFFWNSNDLVLEIGTWLGNFFAKQVQENPQKNYLWLEIRYKRLWLTAQKSLWNKATYAKNTLSNSEIQNFLMLKVFGQDIKKILEKGELSESYIFFPDPWAKKKAQAKHRLLQEKFLNDLYDVTKKWGKCVIKTDHREYFDFALEEIAKTQWNTEFLSYDFENETTFENAETTEFQQLFRGQNIQINHIELKK